MRRTSRRTAFSLLEMVLALAIAMLLLLALYVTLSTQFMHAQIGRDVLSEGELGRSILARIVNDIANQLGPVDPRGLPDYSALTADPNADPAATPSATTPMPTTQVTSVAFNVGVQGDATSLIISGFRMQKPNVSAANANEVSSDLRRIAFWLALNGADAKGLARHEARQATSADIDVLPSELPEQEKHVFAPEVKNILFEYYDGSAQSWTTEWDGSLAGEDGVPLGPPAAIRITLTLRRQFDPNAPSNLAGGEDGASFQHIIALPTSNSFAPKTITP